MPRPQPLPSLLLAALALLAGCQPTKPPRAAGAAPIDTAPPPQAAAKSPAPAGGAPKVGSVLDPCPSRLHDISGVLLIFYNQNRRLPANLAELARVNPDPTLQFVCPETGQPYVYNPIGIMTADKQPRTILYDAAPGHAGYRWAVSIIEPQEENGPLVTKVVALPESAFTLKPPPR